MRVYGILSPQRLWLPQYGCRRQMLNVIWLCYQVNVFLYRYIVKAILLPTINLCIMCVVEVHVFSDYIYLTNTSRSYQLYTILAGAQSGKDTQSMRNVIHFFFLITTQVYYTVAKTSFYEIILKIAQKSYEIREYNKNKFLLEILVYY